MNIKSNLSANDIPSIASPLEETKLPPSASAQARLNGSPVSVQFAGSKKSSIKIPPTAFALAQEKAAYSNYQAALIQQTKEKSSLWSSLFGSKAQKDVKKSLAVLSQLYHEDFHLDKATKESKSEFPAKVAATGGNPDIAEEVFQEASSIFDSSSHTSTQATIAEKSRSVQKSSKSSAASPLKTDSLSPDKLSDIEEAEFDSDPSGVWRDVDPEADQRAQEATGASSLSIENFQTHLSVLNEKEITDLINSLPPEKLIQLATNYFDHSLHDDILQMSAEQLNSFLISTFSEHSKIIQRDIPLIERPRVHEIINQAFLEQPAPVEHQGLSNSGVDCYLNSALQCLRQHFSNLSPETQQALLGSLRAQYREHLTAVSPKQGDLVTPNSPLVAFLEGKFDGRDPIAASFLRLEVRRTMQELAQSGRSSSGAARVIADGVDVATGNSKRQCDSSEALIALMEYVGTTPALIKDERVYLDSNKTELFRAEQELRQNSGGFVLPFGIEQATSLQNVIRSNFVNDITQDSGEAIDGISIFTERRLSNPPDSFTISLSRFRMKPDPAGGWATNSRGDDIVGKPKLLVDAQGHTIPEKLHTSISRLTDDINFPAHDHEGTETQTSYTPTSIICHYGGESANSGHYATYRKENEGWFLVNDAQVTPVHLDDLMADRGNITHRQFLEENAYVVNFKKVV